MRAAAAVLLVTAASCSRGGTPKGWPDAPPSSARDDERACSNAGPSGIAPFDREAAREAMAKVDLSPCRAAAIPAAPDGAPDGAAPDAAAPASDARPLHVFPHVLFCTDGTVGTAEVLGDLRGTAVGECIAERYRTAVVPSFSGVPMRVRNHRVLR